MANGLPVSRRERIAWAVAGIFAALTLVFVWLWNSGTELWGGYDATVSGTWAEWVTGLLTGVAILIAAYQVAAERREFHAAEQARLAERETELDASRAALTRRRQLQAGNITTTIGCGGNNQQVKLDVTVQNSSDQAISDLRFRANTVDNGQDAPFADRQLPNCPAGETIRVTIEVPRDNAGSWPEITTSCVTWTDLEGRPTRRSHSWRIDPQRRNGPPRIDPASAIDDLL